MAVSGALRSSFSTPQQQTAQATVLPAPVGGMDGRVNAATDDPNVCLWAINILPAEYGLRVRSGYREWQIGLLSEARTIITYQGLDTGITQTPDRIFTVTEDGIYDTTIAGAAPINKFMFATVDDDSGWGVYTHYVTESGADLILYADGSNGLFTYDPVADTWAQTTGITSIVTASAPIDITNIVFVVVHKLRIWLVEKGASKAWYLPIRSIAGEAVEFFFAQKFANGGELVGLYNWTVDGGNGRDDHLVAVSRAGDVIPWTGEDPSDDMTWATTGTFFIGQIPQGNRIASEYGGELYLLSTLGVTTMSDLLQGADPTDPFRNLVGYRIALLLRQDLTDYRTDHGWTMRFATSIGKLIITTPQQNDLLYRQYVYNLSTGGWGLWHDVPMLASDIWEGDLMFGTKDGRICRMDVGPDNVTLDGLTQLKIDWFLLTSYNSFGTPAQFKRVKLIRPNFLTEEKPAFDVHSYYDYLVTIAPPPTQEPGRGDGSVWDTALWDKGKWVAGQALPFSSVLGGSGSGRSVAVGLAGASFDDTFLASIDIVWDTGGFL